MPKPAPDVEIPLKDLELLVLLALSEGPLHGYALLERVAHQSSGFVAPGPTSLYRTIGALLDTGLIEPTAAARAANDDPRRRYFRHTPRGRSILHAELRRLSGLLDRARELGVSFETGAR